MSEKANNIMGSDHQLNKTETSILRFLVRNITEEFSIKVISEGIKKSYPSVRNNTLALEKKRAIRIKRLNKTHSLCNLDLTNPDNVGVFSSIDFLERDEFFAKNKDMKVILDDVMNKISGNSFTLILFGSYVKGNYKPDSDIDIILLVSTMEDEKRMQSAVSAAEMLTNRKIHGIVLTYTDFYGLLKKSGANLAKEVLENHIIVYGAESFYRGLVTNV